MVFKWSDFFRRQRMKKLIYMILFFAVLFVITACGNGKEEQSHDRGSEEQEFEKSLK